MLSQDLTKSCLHPTMVRLQLQEAGWCPRVDAVSIPLWFDCNLKQKLLLMVLHHVSIPLWFDCNKVLREVVGLPEPCLHPTMVRLQLSMEGKPHLSSESPSHYGSTATYLIMLSSALGYRSPSHYGSTATALCSLSPIGRLKVSIPLWFDCNSLDLSPKGGKVWGLHPTMVRLQPLRTSSTGIRRPVSIPLWFDCNLLRKHYKRINGITSPSHYGSTATQRYSRRSATSHVVSIPLWFDCNPGLCVRVRGARSGLHPTMVRLQQRR